MTFPDGDTFSRDEDRTFSDMPAGEYSVRWGEVFGWYTPPDVVKTLSPGSTMTFAGTYHESTRIGTVRIEILPELFAASWSLYFESVVVANGYGDSTLTRMPIGEYVMYWQQVDDWSRPPSESALLYHDSEVVFEGVYTRLFGTIVIDTSPDSIDAPWKLHGPSGELLTGAGDTILTGKSVGSYNLQWRPVYDWWTPTKERTLELGNGETVVFSSEYQAVKPRTLASIPPADVPMPTTFLMGSLLADDETPHEVTLTRRFDIGHTEVTTGQFLDALQWAYDCGYVIVDDGGEVYDVLDHQETEILEVYTSATDFDFFDGVFTSPFNDEPVNGVNWFGAASYCDWLSMRDDLPRAYDHDEWSCNNGDPYSVSGYRLPTEAEWELACRAGTTTHFNTGDCIDALMEARFDGMEEFNDCPRASAPGRPVVVGSYPPNGWGLFDLHGNMWEWVNDRYDGDYGGDSITDPTGPMSGFTMIRRGGGYREGAFEIRSANRETDYAGQHRLNGFRIVGPSR